MNPFYLVIPAAGIGLRSGRTGPKQFETVGGHSLLTLTLSRFLGHPALAGVMVALAPNQSPPDDFPVDPRIRLCVGGDTRALSVLKACQALRAPADAWVLVHDAARPFVTHDDIDALLDSLADDRAVYLVGAVADTLRTHDGETLPRERIHRVLTPQGARLGTLIRALDLPVTGTDEVSYLQAAGVPCVPVESMGHNLKITHPGDWALADALARQPGF